ncbi:MAG: hypothetical protein IAE78_23685 [Myxococcus sp.]|nr:hypothetical protein [Myxococcus sp.]
MAAWRSCRAPRLAQQVDWVSARLPVTPVDGHAQWLELAARQDARALPGLLATLTAGSFREAEARGERLVRWDDPRVASGLLALLAAPRYRTSGARYFYELVLSALAARRDSRVPGGLSALAARYHEVIPNSYGPTLAAALSKAAHTMAVDRGDEGPLAPLLNALEPFFESERADAARARAARASLDDRAASLRAAAHARPGDEGRLQVWADALTERGDALGELLSLDALAARQALDEAGLARLVRVRARLRDRLLGTLAPDVVHAVFELGVPVHVELGRQHRVPPPAAREWATVRGVTLPGDQHGDEWPALLAALPALRALMRVTPTVLAQLALRRADFTLDFALLEGTWQVPRTLPLPVAHLAARAPVYGPLLAAHPGPTITLEANAPDEAVALLANARARRSRFVDGVHWLEPAGWYGWCCEWDAVARRVTARARFSGAVDGARLGAWLAALRRLGPREVHLDASPQRDVLGVWLESPSFDASLVTRAADAAGCPAVVVERPGPRQS